jgi:hypothetical protein
MTCLDSSHHPCYITGLEFHCLPDGMIHISRFGGENDGVMELDAVSQDDDVLYYG